MTRYDEMRSKARLRGLRADFERTPIENSFVIHSVEKRIILVDGDTLKTVTSVHDASRMSLVSSHLHLH